MLYIDQLKTKVTIKERAMLDDLVVVLNKWLDCLPVDGVVSLNRFKVGYKSCDILDLFKSLIYHKGWLLSSQLQRIDVPYEGLGCLEAIKYMVLERPISDLHTAISLIVFLKEFYKRARATDSYTAILVDESAARIMTMDKDWLTEKLILDMMQSFGKATIETALISKKPTRAMLDIAHKRLGDLSRFSDVLVRNPELPIEVATELWQSYGYRPFDMGLGIRDDNNAMSLRRQLLIFGCRIDEEAIRETMASDEALVELKAAILRDYEYLPFDVYKPYIVDMSNEALTMAALYGVEKHFHTFSTSPYANWDDEHRKDIRSAALRSLSSDRASIGLEMAINDFEICGRALWPDLYRAIIRQVNSTKFSGVRPRRQ